MALYLPESKVMPHYRRLVQQTWRVPRSRGWSGDSDGRDYAVIEWTSVGWHCSFRCQSQHVTTRLKIWMMIYLMLFKAVRPVLTFHGCGFFWPIWEYFWGLQISFKTLKVLNFRFFSMLVYNIPYLFIQNSIYLISPFVLFSTYRSLYHESTFKS